MRPDYLLMVASLVTVPLTAAPCLSGPFSTYTAAGFSCEVNSATFSNFSLFLQNDGGGDILGEGDITVSPLIEPGIVGLRFAGEFQATGAANGPGPAQGIRINEYRIFFEVTRPGSVFTSVGSRLNDPLRIVQNPLKFGNIFASNFATNDGAQSFADDDDPDLTEFVNLNSERMVVPVDNLIHLAAGASAEGTVAPVGFVSLSSADYLYTYREVGPAIPEPSTWALCLLSFAALTALRRSRSSLVSVGRTPSAAARRGSM
jgi:hypothetical protein